MTTLYDLLGALPTDDAEALRTAFRRAVKGAHPDLRPGDPDAALKFRQIVRANEILGDAEQREAYDHLLELGRLEQESASRQAFAARIHKLASGVMALAGASVVTVGGYLLFMHMSAASVASASRLDLAMGAPSEIATVTGAAITPGAAMSPPDTESAPAANAGPAPGLAAGEAVSSRARGISSRRAGDLNGTVAGLDRAIEPDPQLLPAYIDRGTIFFRLRKRIHRAFADIGQAKRTEKASRPISASMIGGRPRMDQAAIAPSVMSWFRRRTAAQDPSREEGVGSVRLR